MQYNKDNPLKVFTTFSGYDSQCLAFNKANIPYELIGWSDIEKRAIDAHNILFPEAKDKNYGDIRKIDWEHVPDFDFFTYSSPCQSFSISGLKTGGEEGSGTQSSLLWECKKAITIKKPKYLMMENVKNLVGSKFLPTFNKWLEFLSSLGYTSYWKVLNGADYGIPQARERVFVISILNPKHVFIWSKPHKLKTCINDFLQKPNQIPKECYVNQNIIDDYVENNPQILKFAGETFDDIIQDNKIIKGKDVLNAKSGKQTNYVNKVVKEFDELLEENLFGETSEELNMFNQIIQIGNVRGDRKTFANPQSTRIYSPKGLAPTLTLCDSHYMLVKENGNYKIRELTGVERMRLMGVENSDIQKLVDNGFSNGQLNKLAGNSIIVDVMSEFYKNLF